MIFALFQSPLTCHEGILQMNTCESKVKKPRIRWGME